MSSTNRGGKRSPADFYATPRWATRLFLESGAMPLPLGGAQWLEPSAGSGAIVRAVDEFYCVDTPRWTLVEMRTEERPALVRFGETYTEDFLDWSDLRIADLSADACRPFAACISNPPFALAAEFLERCCALADHVAFLLRMNFLTTEKRAPLWERLGVPDLYVHPQRISFTGTGSDSSDYAWHVFHRDRPRKHGEVHLLPLLTDEERSVPRLAAETPVQVALELGVVTMGGSR